MQEVFSKIIGKIKTDSSVKLYGSRNSGNYMIPVDKAIEIVKQAAAEYNNGWISCSVAMPPVETEVFIVAKRKYRGGEVRYIATTAMYEDGTVLENDSCWCWQDIEVEWEEENDYYIIPQGWWESRHYNPDDIYDNAVDDEVVAWQPLPAPYQPKGE